ncbi:MAG TPA: chorismate synthase [Phycisphaerales bacterium]|nr:chorismate synthase [Phycisphaerales bacterium]
MPSLSFITAGESHGPALTTIVSGLPAELPIDLGFINRHLARRQGGYGRGARQKIESDRAEILSGVRGGVTTGSPLTIQIVNKDSRLEDVEKTPALTKPRPGHADLAGALKYSTTDCRNVLERASARETAARTAAGLVAQLLLREFEIVPFGFVRGMLDAQTDVEPSASALETLTQARDASNVFCPDGDVTEKIIQHIHRAKTEQDTVGGLCEVHVFNVPAGLGSCMQWDLRLDARLAGAVMSIQAFKSVEIGLGKDVAFLPGSKVHDAIQYDAKRAGTPCMGFTRPTNNAGGIEGGMSNGMPIVVRGAMKPISTLLRGMPSVDLKTLEAAHSAYERSDVCALPAASVVMENVVAFEIAKAFLEKFSGDTMRDVRAAFEHYLRMNRSEDSAAGETEHDQSEA